MLDVLYQIIIFPLYAFFEVMFNLFFVQIGINIILSIFFISFLVNIICLPLYINADKLQNEEKEIQRKLAPKIDIIKRNFKGDERHMLLQTYYRQNNYHPIMSLRLSFSLLLQIPFFLAAYLFFNNLPMLDRLYLCNICKLSEPDGMLTIGLFSINILPIFMTCINLFAGYIYSKDSDNKEKIQLWIMSLIFLVLLYNSPSGLVIYWTFNNLFSLIKNISLKVKSPKKFILNILLLIFLSLYFISKNYYVNYYNLDLFIIIIICFYILCLFKINFLHNISVEVLRTFNKFNITSFYNFSVLNNTKIIYILSCISLWLLFGLVIPSNVIATSPVQFLYIEKIKTAFYILSFPFIQAFGIFCFWGLIIYTFTSKKLKPFISFAALTALFIALFNMYYIKLPNYPLTIYYEYVSPELINFNFPSVNAQFIYNSFVLLICIISLVLFFSRKFLVIKNILVILLLTFLTIGVKNIITIENEYKYFKKVSISSHSNKDKVQFSLSKNKQNVLILFLDTAISSYLPFIFDEKPELKEIYEGFIYYPNTVSFYGHTIFAYPALIGGYEYTPLEMAKRNDELLVKKHNEALLVLPTIFKNNGWNATISDYPFVDYKNVSDSSIFKDKGIEHKYLNDVYGAYYAFTNNIIILGEMDLSHRNCIYFSFLHTSPNSVKNFIYSHGKYLDMNYTSKNKMENLSRIINNYAELYYLPKLIDFSSDKKSFVVINNDLTHEWGLLSLPDYKLNNRVENDSRYNISEYSIKRYHVNAAALILLGDFFKILKENNVYDNTRIIIVSDHTTDVQSINSDFKFNYFNPLLLIKDFNSKEPFKTSYEFMTNADVPYLATKDIIENPTNPYTGKAITNKNKENGVYIDVIHDWKEKEWIKEYSPINEHDKFYFIKDNIFDESNWKLDIPYSDIKDKI